MRNDFLFKLEHLLFKKDKKNNFIPFLMNYKLTEQNKSSQ